jgi:two-component system cell cycle sensor histidine kinase/response regulator CckA
VKFSQKVMLIPVVAVLCFSVAIVVDYLTDKANARLLEQVQTSYLPAMQLSHEVESSLTTVERHLGRAVSAVAPDELIAADGVSHDLLQQLERGRVSGKLSTPEALALRTSFGRYYADRREQAERLLNQRSGDSSKHALGQPALELNELRATIDEFEAKQRAGVVEAIERARTNQERAGRTTLFALALAVLLLVGVSRAVYRSTVGAVRAACADASALLARSSAFAPTAAVEPAGDEITVLLASLRGAANAVAESEERYRRLFDESPVPMWLFDMETLRFLAVNHATLGQYGYSRDELLSMSVLDIRPPEERVRLRETLPSLSESGTVDAGHWFHLRKDGSRIDVEVTSHVLRLSGGKTRLVVARDVTEKRRLEQQLRQSHKMEAVGRLAAGVAHDFNNVLNVIMGYTEMIERRLPSDAPVRQKADEILKAVGRASSLTRQLLTFSRQHEVQPRLLDLNVVVTDVSKMLRRLIGENIDLRTHLTPDLGAIKADPGQMEQVLMNLCVNARDAMPEGGTLIIETHHVACDVVIEVSDTGCGMDGDTRSRLFEPFFTTKAEGKGTGLGLATVYGIVQNSGGRIEVRSESGHGTTFTISLPRAEGRAPREVVEAPKAAPECAGETILLVEDEELVREMIVDTLGQSGYRVLSAATPWQALAMAEAHKGTIDVVLTDVVMPGLTGVDVAERLKPLRPGVPVVYMSGYSNDVMSRYGLSVERGDFLLKPFTTDALLARMRESIRLRRGVPPSVGIPAA